LGASAACAALRRAHGPTAQRVGTARAFAHGS